MDNSLEIKNTNLHDFLVKDQTKFSFSFFGIILVHIVSKNQPHGGIILLQIVVKNQYHGLSIQVLLSSEHSIDDHFSPFQSLFSHLDQFL